MWLETVYVTKRYLFHAYFPKNEYEILLKLHTMCENSNVNHIVQVLWHLIHIVLPTFIVW